MSEDNFDRDTFYYTITHSPQWKLWEKEQNRRMIKRRKTYKGCYDIPEVLGCGRISQEHFQDFIKFCKGMR